ncbi:homocysteine S-methyltransferase family protein [Robinsoniella peoriensis]|uniref:homocysteine S-methyltransferase family protein n=1 Tax=Robinsoniella peoriensis TaxID=180332 RepID=UPI0005C7B290|nr:homocysteine S-methyltransferase family protein [Robinsoniella peoriensis]
MTKQEFAEWAGRETIILDGATGSNLIKAGLGRGVCTEQWILEHPQVLIDLQRAYADAGSNIVYAPTFAANRMNLKYYGLDENIRQMNHDLVRLSKEAVQGRAYVAGDLTTSGKIIGASDEVTYESLLEMYKEQIIYLVEAGVDLLVAETMISIDETLAVLDAAAEVCDLPVMCSMTLEADGSVFAGGTAWDAVESLQEMGASAVGLNCSVGPDQLESVVASMKRVASVPIMAKPNAGMPTITETGEAIYNMNAKDFAKHMMVLVKAGAGIVGGCCGTTPEYIELLAGNIR